SSIVSYITSQQIDIRVFSGLKKLTGGKYLSSRSLISMIISTFLDNFIFSVLAWMIFASRPASWSSLWNTYILITYLMRLIIAALCVPLVKLAKIFLGNHNV
ncbi:MAG: queuosine precursor transporter, partial [Holosporaceae bacterium]|nr:queuosine precursor transporter [Holosporaceae bacterium]